MKSSIIYLTDVHLSDKGPKSRSDNYFESICTKLEFVDKLSEELNVSFVMVGGDVCHGPYENFRVFNWLNTFLKNSKRRWKTLIGQGHDFVGNWMATKEKTILYSLSENGVIDLLDDTFRTTIEGVKVFASHQAIVPGTFWGHHIPYAELNEDCDLVLCSHIHSPFPPQIVNGKTFLAPGSVSRNASDMFNIGRIPQCIYIEFEDGKFKYEFIDLPCQLDIWNHDHLIVKEKARDMPETRSLDSLKTLMDCNREALDGSSIIKTLGVKYPSEAVEKALELNQKAKQ